MYQFSVPMPFDKKYIDKLVYINSKIKKSKITGVYFAFPVASELACGFEQGRTYELKNKDFEFWKELIEYSHKNNFKTTYLFNSPKPFSLYGNHINTQLKKVDRLIEKLTNIGCTRFRVGNIMLLNYLNDKYPDLEYCTSTSNEYAFLSQYISYFNTYPNIKEIVPYFDVNRNFRLLKNLKKTFPNLDIEMMVNEGCLHGCAFRSFHPLSLPSSIYESEEDLSKREAAIIYCTNRNCTKIFDADPFGQLFKSNIIYPWDIEEYAKIGINRFKLVGRDNHSFFTGDFLEYYYIYLKGVDNYKDILDRPFYVLNNYINNSKHQIPFSIKEIIDYIPKVEYFVKNGHRCLSECGVTCTYCDDCAKKFQKMLDSKKTKN